MWAQQRWIWASWENEFKGAVLRMRFFASLIEASTCCSRPFPIYRESSQMGRKEKKRKKFPSIRRMFTFHLTRRTRWKYRNPFHPPLFVLLSSPFNFLRLDLFMVEWLLFSADGFHSEKLGNYWNMKGARQVESWCGEHKFEFCCRKKPFLSCWKST